jgi:RND family efflux transporter MFP subunit
LITSRKWVFALLIGLSNMAGAAALSTAAVTKSNDQQVFTAEGVVEAIKSSVIAPQVSGSITLLAVKVGDHVKAGQLLARIDTRMASQQAMTNHAQVAAAQAQLSAARSEYERKHRLFEKQYISQAALERSESEFKTAEAQAKAQLAQTGMAGVQTSLHTINAPYAGVIAGVMAEMGDMAMPGKPLFAVYEPTGYRLVVNVPQSKIAYLKHGAAISVLIPAAKENERSLMTTQLTIFPTADPISNMVMLRLTLPLKLTSVAPGMFARAMLPVEGLKGQAQIYIPAKAVIKRSELMAVYVVDKQGNPHLRQVRLGRKVGDNIEVFAGLLAGEIVALDPIAAANFK